MFLFYFFLLFFAYYLLLYFAFWCIIVHVDKYLRIPNMLL